MYTIKLSSTFKIVLTAMFMLLYACTTVLTPKHTHALAEAVVINEVKPSSVGGTQRWVELYNTSSDPVEISGWRVVRSGVSGTFTNVIPTATILAAHQFYVLSSTTQSLPQSSNGAAVELWSGPASTGSLVDSIDYGASVPAESSYARITDGSADWNVAVPTKGASNNVIEQQTTRKVLQSDFANSMVTWTYHDPKKPLLQIANPFANDSREIGSNPNPTTDDNGAIKLTSHSGEHFGIASLQYSGTKLADITKLGFSVFTNIPTKVSAELDIDFNQDGFTGWYGNLGWQGRLVYKPAELSTDSWNNVEAVASNGTWSWSRFKANGNVWPDGNTNKYRTWEEVVNAFPDSTVSAVNTADFGSLYFRAKDEGVTYYDNVYLSTAASDVVYNFEI